MRQSELLPAYRRLRAEGRGAKLQATVTTLTCKEATVRIVLVVASRKSPTDTDQAVFAFIGDASKFDSAAMEEFLASLN